MTSSQKKILFQNIIELIDSKKLSAITRKLLVTEPNLARKLINFEKKYLELKMKASKTMTQSELSKAIKSLENFI